MGVAVAVVVLVASLAAFVANALWSLDDSNVSFSTDQRVVETWEEQLAPALAELNGLGPLAGLREAGPARVQPCSVDSGQLYDLWAGREWPATTPGSPIDVEDVTLVPAIAKGFRQLIDRLVASGWRVTDRSDQFGMQLPPGLDFDTVGLVKRDARSDRVANRIGIQVDNSGVLVSVWFARAPRACKLT